MVIDLIAGARPNFVKVASLIEALRTRASSPHALRYRLIHTGQHHTFEMSGSLFEQLGLPRPDVELGIPSGTPAEQTAAIMVRYEAAVARTRPRACVVVGDVTSTMACAIVARKAQIPVAHVEAGIRSRDWAMPEEINRVVTDSITNWFFTTTLAAGANLESEGVSADRIFFVGNTMIDTLLRHRDRFQRPAFLNEAASPLGPYIVLTLHRPSNVDDVGRLTTLLDVIAANCQDARIIFPVHPRTAERLESARYRNARIHFVAPQSYLEFNYLVANALGVVTDSGGVTEETTVLHVPCMTIRDSTERPETVSIGTNELIGSDPAAIPKALERLLSGEWKRGAIPDLWDGGAGLRIIEHLERLVDS